MYDNDTAFLRSKQIPIKEKKKKISASKRTLLFFFPYFPSPALFH